VTPTRYLVPARDGSAELVVKHSRFLCTLVRVSSEAQARAVVDRVRKQHWDARHHCSAFILGPASEVQRSSDDGEPAGTAGAPMLVVLRGREVSDVVAVVTRWFGGVLLGAGGLVRAYGDTVRAALDEVGVLERRLVQEFTLSVSHAEAGRVESDLRARGVQVLDAAYGSDVTLRLGVLDAASLAPLVGELTGGAAAPRRVGESWVDLS
jgi:uncharacterized YigZ family protein